MANHTYSKGLLYKKTLNSSGEVTGSVPLLLKTLGSLVIMSDGTDAETAISTAISNMVTPDETTIVTGQDGITISVKKSTSAEIDEILGDVPTEHTWEGYYTKSETEALIDAVDDKISQSGIETALGYTPIPTTAKGSNNGVAELDSAGKVPAAQLPSYVDDVVESATYAALPATGESGKIYVTLNDDKTYRWSGSAYVEISASLALGETSGTAYRGDRGKTAYDHSQAAHARTDATNAAIVSGKLNINGTATNIGDFKAVSTAASQGLTDTEKTNALANIGAVPNSDFVVAENNIVSVQNKVGINYIYDYEHGMTVSTTYSGITFTWKDNGKLNIKATGVNTSEVYYNLEIDIGSKYVGKILSCVGCNSYVKLCISQASGSSAVSTQGDDIVIPSNAVNRVFVAVYANAPSFDIDIEPMIRDSIITSNTYSAPALPNNELTVLEAEDRVALAEEIDAGAKNIIDVSSYTHVDNVSISNGVFTTAGDTATTFRLDAVLRNNSNTTLLKVVDAEVISTNGVYHWEFTAPANVNNILLGHNGGTYNGRATIPLSLVSGQRYVLQLNVTQATSSVGQFKWQDVMICTKAAFGISTKFVPYTKSNSQLTTELGSVQTVLEAIL